MDITPKQNNQRVLANPTSLTQYLEGIWQGALCLDCQCGHCRDQTALTINADKKILPLRCKKGGCDFRDVLVAGGIAGDSVEIGLLAMEAYVPDNIKLVCRLVGAGLWLESSYAWIDLILVFQTSLSVEQRAALAFVVLKSLDRETAALTAEAVLSGDAGQPIAPLFSHMDEAGFWADMATPAEHDAYCLACYNRMQPHRQAAFLKFVQERSAA